MADKDAFSRRGALTAALLLSLTAEAGRNHAHAAIPAAGGGRVLVAYYSRTGNTRVVARQIQLAYGAALFEIRTAEPYPDDYEATVRQAERERQAGYRPPLAATLPSLDAYDVVFLGFPIWGTTAPAAVRSFLAAHDLSGKTLVPFITHGGYGPGSSVQVVAEHAPGARLLDAFTLRQDQERETLAQVTSWMGGLAIDR
ncbi:flavodoxin [Ancylobacter sp. Lp-2]|uniref:flavodoxin n=1 Tax=Ancylobacter sp. Lp-2 TaxID=2881339 RepID=UPI001E46551D|nr:flavodoxin [Ancylobacter sp. Lp-2]MCB4769097.1 flavodoxin [Ancylobacter sp. Lp-2]